MRARSSSAASFDGLITSPPYPKRIDYHGQHRYAFELLGLEDRVPEEIGNPSRGCSRAALETYCDDVAQVLANARDQLRPGAPVVIVIDDVRHLYDVILERAGLELVEHRVRHVNRRTGRRDEGYFEAVLVRAHSGGQQTPSVRRRVPECSATVSDAILRIRASARLAGRGGLARRTAEQLAQRRQRRRIERRAAAVVADRAARG